MRTHISRRTAPVTKVSPLRGASGSAALLAAALLGIVPLVGCTPTAPATTDSAGTASSEEPATSKAAGADADCSSATTAGYDLFVDPEVTVDPALDVYPLQSESDKITFTYTGDTSGSPTYTWDIAYIQPEGGEVSPQGGSPFFDEAGGVFSISGPQSTIGVDGGPYTAFLDVTKTSNASFNEETQQYTADTKVIARLCVLLAE
ncbi:MAG: hypothetical protein LCH36_07725 [Actinobacteria bacterium]|nr:hypothetical protein [Actinomycetota bacterium]